MAQYRRNVQAVDNIDHHRCGSENSIAISSAMLTGESLQPWPGLVVTAFIDGA